MDEETNQDYLEMLVSKWPKPMNKCECCFYFAEMAKLPIYFMERNIELVLSWCIDDDLLVKKWGLYKTPTCQEHFPEIGKDRLVDVAVGKVSSSSNHSDGKLSGARRRYSI